MTMRGGVMCVPTSAHFLEGFNKQQNFEYVGRRIGEKAVNWNNAQDQFREVGVEAANGKINRI